MVVNRKKTVILSTLLPAADDVEALTRTSWADIAFSESEKYLGVKIGRNLTPKDIYSLPLQKFQERIREIQKLKYHITPANRVIVANVFLIPIFSYTYQFYMVPPCVQRTVDTALRQFLIPHAQYKLECLKFPRLDFGLRQPLKDLKWMSLAALVRRARPEVIVNHFPLLISHQIQAARAEYLLVAVQDPDPNPVATRKELYLKLVDCPSSKTKRARELTRKINRLQTLVPGAYTNLITNWNKIGRYDPEILKMNLIQTVYNAHNTHRRTRRFSAREDRSCTLCMAVEMESYPHFFTDCAT